MNPEQKATPGCASNQLASVWFTQQFAHSRRTDSSLSLSQTNIKSAFAFLLPGSLISSVGYDASEKHVLVIENDDLHPPLNKSSSARCLRGDGHLTLMHRHHSPAGSSIISSASNQATIKMGSSLGERGNSLAQVVHVVFSPHETNKYQNYTGHFYANYL